MSLEKVRGQIYLPCMRQIAKRTLRVSVTPEDSLGPYESRYFAAPMPNGGGAMYWDWPYLKQQLEDAWGEPLRFIFYCSRTKKDLPGEPRVIRGKALPLLAGEGA